MTNSHTHTTRVRIIAIAALLALAGLAASSGPARAGTYRSATFIAEIKGVQTYTFDLEHASTGPCDVSASTRTRETVRFAATRPVRLRITELPGLADPVITPVVKPGASAALRLPVRATITRRHAEALGTVAPECPDNGGGVTQVETPDCGTKVVRPWWLTIDYFRRGRVELQPEDQAGTSPFEHCGTGYFPQLLVGQHLGRRPSAELDPADVFDERYGRLITIGRGDHRIIAPDSDERVRIRWELSLRRVRS